MRVSLIRHGQTLDNARGVLQGQLGRGLSEEGRAQVERLRGRLEGRTYAGLYTSDLERAAESAQMLAPAVRLAPLKEPLLREVDIGAWSGLTFCQVAERFPEEHARWSAGEDLPRGGGETYAAVGERMEIAMRNIAQAHPTGHVLAVSHGTAIRALSARILGLRAHRFPSWPVMVNTAITVIELDGPLLKLITWNDASHLEAPLP
ncbi:MAG: histidine phosphatase family protein [Polyangiaceae bacterium]|jgi:broad specificity phosphatase PhoE|nr:histidine phosphatase family protein [Polyangiaceae bacterium]